MIVFWALVILIIAGLVKWLLPQDHSPKQSALTILEERYAKGEIDKEEFEEKKRILSN